MRKIKTFIQTILSRVWFYLLLAAVIIGTFLLFFIPDTVVSNVTAIKIAALSALFAAIGSLAAAYQALEAQKQRELLERPSIIAYFDVSSDGEVQFVIKNIGNSPATEITVAFDPPLNTTYKGMTLGFDNPISYLPPEKSIRQIYKYGHSLDKDKDEIKFKSHVKYKSLDNTIFTEEYNYDLSYLWEMTFPDKTTNELLDEISRNISEISRGIRTPGMGRLTQPKEVSLESISESLEKLLSVLEKSESDK